MDFLKGLLQQGVSAGKEFAKKEAGKLIGGKGKQIARTLGEKAIGKAQDIGGKLAGRLAGKLGLDSNIGEALASAAIGGLGEQALTKGIAAGQKLVGQTVGKGLKAAEQKLAPAPAKMDVDEALGDGLGGLFAGAARMGARVGAVAIPQQYPGQTTYMSRMMPSAPLTAVNRTAGRLETSRMAGGAPYESLYGGAAPIGAYRSLINPNDF